MSRRSQAGVSLAYCTEVSLPSHTYFPTRNIAITVFTSEHKKTLRQRMIDTSKHGRAAAGVLTVILGAALDGPKSSSTNSAKSRFLCQSFATQGD